MPPKKQKKAPEPIPTKASFFAPKRDYEDHKKVDFSSSPPVPTQKQPKYQSFLYDHGTGRPYAEIVGRSAICVDSGEELFRFRNGPEEEDEECVSGPIFTKKFDFTPPSGKRHPDDRGIDIAGLVEFGLLSDEDVRSRKVFTAEQLQDMMGRLAAFRGELS